MALWTDSKAVLVVGVIVAGGFLGVNNTFVTETVMTVAPVERGADPAGSIEEVEAVTLGT